MRIALDATPLSLSSGGLRRYVEELSQALAGEFPEDQILLASDQPFSAPAGILRLESPLTRRWWLSGLPRALRRERISVFHGTNFEVPYLPVCPSVLTLHDLSPWMDPGWHHGAGRVRTRTPWLLRLRVATMVLTVSEAIRRQAIERFGLRPDRVIAVPSAAAPRFRPVQPLRSTPYFLFVGTLEPRKNLPLLIDSWREVYERHHVELVLAGRARADAPRIPPLPGLVSLGEVAEVDLPALYSGALALVYPSRYEGFGLPVLEAMQCGTIAITSRDAALREVGGDAAAPAGTVEEFRDAMLAVIENRSWAARRRELSLERARAFSWARTARCTRDVYLEALARW